MCPLEHGIFEFMYAELCRFYLQYRNETGDDGLAPETRENREIEKQVQGNIN